MRLPHFFILITALILVAWVIGTYTGRETCERANMELAEDFAMPFQETYLCKYVEHHNDFCTSRGNPPGCIPYYKVEYFEIQRREEGLK